LPRTIEIEKLAGLGTTWYERGFGYWVRRVVLVLVWLLVLALVGSLLWGFFGAIRESSVTAFRIALGVEIVWSLGVMVFLGVQVARHWNKPRLARQKPISRRQYTLIRYASLLGIVFLLIGSLLMVGLYVMMLLLAFLPETIWERPARLRMAELLQSRGT
jgi:hypothetical protein